MRTEIVVVCGSGSKWTTGLIPSTPDPCPNGQQMTTSTIQFLEQSDLQQTTDFNSADNAMAFSLAFSAVIFCWLAAKGIGIVVNSIRQM